MSTRRVLTLRFHHGVRADDTANLLALGIDPMELMETLVTIYTRMIIVDGFLHADPHPGNLLIDRDGNVIILDFGMAIRFEPDVKREILKSIIAAVRGDVSSMINGFYKLGMVEPGTNMATLRDAARVLLNINFTTRYTPRMIQKITEEILRTFYNFPLRLPSNLVYLFRAAVIIEGIGICFDPMFNGVRFATPIVRQMIREIHLDTKRPLHERLLDMVGTAREFAENLDRLVFRAEREELRIRVHPADLAEIEGYFSNVQRRMLVGMLTLALAIVTAIVYLGNYNLVLLISGEALALVMFAALLVLPVTRRWRE